MMKKWVVVAVLLAMTLFPLSAEAEQAQQLEITEMVFSTAVVNKTPQGTGTSFDAAVDQLYCYTKITGATEPTTLWHYWYFNDVQQAAIILKINNSPWRTWSSKKILPGWIGNWRVDAVTSTGEVLASKTFQITFPAE